MTKVNQHLAPRRVGRLIAKNQAFESGEKFHDVWAKMVTVKPKFRLAPRLRGKVWDKKTAGMQEAVRRMRQRARGG